MSALLLRFGTLPQQLRYIRYYTSVASFYVENFGCRATQSDGAALDRQFAARGLRFFTLHLREQRIRVGPLGLAHIANLTR